LRGPAPDAGGFFVLKPGLLDGALPCFEESPPGLVDSEGNLPAPKASTGPMKPANLGNQRGRGPMLAALGPEVLFRLANFLPVPGTNGGLEPEPALVVVDRMVATVPVDVAKVKGRDGTVILPAMLAGYMVG